jgi:23S rRNA G2445 N2-methylase RlmL
VQWGDYDREAWTAVVEQAAAARHPPPAGVEAWGNDVHKGALSLALHDVEASGMARMVRLHHGECRGWELPRPPTVIVSNPPWARRLGGRTEGDDNGEGVAEWWEKEATREQQQRAAAQQPSRDFQQQQQREDAALAATWYDLSAFLKQQCGGSKAFLLSGNPEATKGLRLKADRRHPVTVGGVDCRLLQYSIRGADPLAAGAQAAVAAVEAGPAAAAMGGPAADGQQL